MAHQIAVVRHRMTTPHQQKFIALVTVLATLVVEIAKVSGVRDTTVQLIVVVID